ncbi:hypothetical protein TWF281_004160 [Arthrobotrys megalospora]
MARSTPPEVQDLILEAADNSQYPTLRLVCKSWDTTILRIFKKQYRELPNTDESDIKKYFGRAYAAPGESLTPFLVHKAVCEFTGYARIKEDWSQTENIYQIDTDFESGEDPAVIAETLRLKACADDPVFIRDTSKPHDIRYPIYLGWVAGDPASVALAGQGGSSGHSFIATKNNIQDYRDRVSLKGHNTMKIAEFVSLYFQYTKRDERYPPQRGKGGKFVVHTGMWAPFYADATAEAMEAVKRIDIKIVYME